MACFLLRGPAGERWLAENVPYTLLVDEFIVPGEINWACGPNALASRPFKHCSNCGQDGVYEST